MSVVKMAPTSVEKITVACVRVVLMYFPEKKLTVQRVVQHTTHCRNDGKDAVFRVLEEMHRDKRSTSRGEAFCRHKKSVMEDTVLQASQVLTIEHKDDTQNETNDKCGDDVSRLPWVCRAAPGQSHQEKQETSCKQNDADIIQISEFLQLRASVCVQGLKVGWMIEEEIESRRETVCLSVSIDRRRRLLERLLYVLTMMFR